MVDNVLVAMAVIVAFYFIIRFILKRLAGSGEVNPCQGCSGCSMGTGHQMVQRCESSMGDASKTALIDETKGK